MAERKKAAGEFVHIASFEVEAHGRYLRQRCAWCGAILLDYDLTLVAGLEGQDPRPSTWPAGAMVAVTGNVSSVHAEADSGARLPPNACACLDPAVTA